MALQSIFFCIKILYVSFFLKFHFSPKMEGVDTRFAAPTHRNLWTPEIFLKLN
jgi:hypothetical protein